MRIGCYGDVHLTKNMRSLQSIWEVTATKSLYHMYDTFDDLGVELVVCLGDFFDTPRLEAKHLNFVLPILSDINSRSYPTYILLGNHEADSETSNILEYLEVYDNIHPVTSTCIIEDLMFIPYYEDLSELDIPEDKVIFTHHDIYGSELASGKTRAFFGYDPSLLANARLVLNGHVHLKSRVASNIINAGSLLISQQGELKPGEYPQYYIFDSKRINFYDSIDNKHSMIYLTLDVSDVDSVVKSAGYDPMHCVLRIEYDGELPDHYISAAHVSWKRRLSSIDSKEDSVHTEDRNFDMKNYIIDHIKRDSSVSDKETYITTVLELLS